MPAQDSWRRPRTPPRGNRLLASLSDADRARLSPALVECRLDGRQLLYRAGDRINTVYFPDRGFVSLLAPLADGSLTQVAQVGPEGILGVSAAFDDGPIAYAALAHPSLQARTLPAPVLRADMRRRGAFHDLIGLYSQALTSTIMLSSACLARHSVRQRLACWLLLAQDGGGSARLAVTHDIIGMMVGATRQRVATIAGDLKRDGVIDYRHGQVLVTRRSGLEQAACECYDTATALMRAVAERGAAPRR